MIATTTPTIINSNDTSISVIVADAMWLPNSLKTDLNNSSKRDYGSDLLFYM